MVEKKNAKNVTKSQQTRMTLNQNPV